jgi:hypothetical protein
LGRTTKINTRKKFTRKSKKPNIKKDTPRKFIIDQLFIPTITIVRV